MQSSTSEQWKLLPMEKQKITARLERKIAIKEQIKLIYFKSNIRKTRTMFKINKNYDENKNRNNHIMNYQITEL